MTWKYQYIHAVLTTGAISSQEHFQFHLSLTGHKQKHFVQTLKPILSYHRSQAYINAKTKLVNSFRKFTWLLPMFLVNSTLPFMGNGQNGWTICYWESLLLIQLMAPVRDRWHRTLPHIHNYTSKLEISRYRASSQIIERQNLFFWTRE